MKQPQQILDEIETHIKRLDVSEDEILEVDLQEEFLNIYKLLRDIQYEYQCFRTTNG